MTLLTADWIYNELGYENEWSPHMTKVKLKEYYYNTCANIREVFYLKPTNAEIEQYITNGKYVYKADNGVFTAVKCPISDFNERVYIFLMAQAKQLVYDLNKGRTAVVDGENLIAPDSLMYIKQLGLYQRTEFTV